jgi:hypothetical protein
LMCSAPPTRATWSLIYACNSARGGGAVGARLYLAGRESVATNRIGLLAVPEQKRCAQTPSTFKQVWVQAADHTIDSRYRRFVGSIWVV